MTVPATAQNRYLDRISRARSLAQKELEEYQSSQDDSWDQLFSALKAQGLITRLKPLMPLVEEAQNMYKSLLYSLPAGHPVVVQMGILHWQHFVPLQRTLEKPMNTMSREDVALLKKMADVLPKFLDVFRSASAKARASSQSHEEYIDKIKGEADACMKNSAVLRRRSSART